MRLTPNPPKIEEVLSRGVEEVIDKEHLRERLFSGRKLRIKFGIDPTTPVLHLGHSVAFLKLKQFQELGHQVIFLIGDFTAQIGDPTGRAALRPPLSPAGVKKNMRGYQQQASRILDMNKVEIRYNTEWWDKMNLREVIALTTKVTYSQVSQRADLKKRLAKDEDFTLQEFMYPVLQGYDSVALKADLEIGGTDQRFNMLMGRRIQKRYQQSPQDIMTFKLLIGTDGAKKMSKTFGNFISITASPQDQYGKIMSIPDQLTLDYFLLATHLPLIEIRNFKKLLKENKIPPQLLKKKLAREVISIYHGEKKAVVAEKEFQRVFQEKKLPSRMPSVKVRKKNINILDLLVKIKLASSRAEAKRLIEQGGVKIDDKTQKDWKREVKVKKGMVIQVGKRKFIKIS